MYKQKRKHLLWMSHCANKSIYWIQSLTLIYSQIAAWRFCLSLCVLFVGTHYLMEGHFSAGPSCLFKWGTYEGKNRYHAALFPAPLLFFFLVSVKLTLVALVERIHMHKNGVWLFLNCLTRLWKRLLLASSGTALERLPLCGKHYDIMQVDLIDLMEHADAVLKPSFDEM